MIGFLPNNRYNEWDEFVEKHRFGTIYHSTAWMKILKRTFNVREMILCEYTNDSILSGIPFLLHNNVLRGKRLLSVTSAQACNPLVNSQEQLTALINFLTSFVKKEKLKFVQLRTDEFFDFQIDGYNSINSDFFTYILDLSVPYEEIKNKYHRSCILKPLNKLDPDQFKLVRSSEEKLLRKFYTNYEMMRKEHGLLPQPFEFFKGMVENLSAENRVDIFHLIYNDKVISSVINLKYKNKYTYEYGATNKEFINLHPSHFLIDYSIKTAINSGYKQFDFGRTDTANAGLENFKRRWGGRKSIFKYYHILAEQKADQASSLDTKVYQFINSVITHTPKKIYHILGPIIYKKAF